MKITQERSKELLRTIAAEEIPPDLSPKTAQDALSIVMDAINSTVGGLIITDLNGTVRFANPSFCRMFDYALDDIIGKNAADLFSTKEIRTFSDVVAILDISKDDTQEFVVKSKEDKNFVVEVSATNVTSSSGELAGRMASFIDITQRKEIEADREKLVGMLGGDAGLKQLKILEDRIAELEGLLHDTKVGVKARIRRIVTLEAERDVLREERGL